MADEKAEEATEIMNQEVKPAEEEGGQWGLKQILSESKIPIWR